MYFIYSLNSLKYSLWSGLIQRGLKSKPEACPPLFSSFLGGGRNIFNRGKISPEEHEKNTKKFLYCTQEGGGGCRISYYNKRNIFGICPHESFFHQGQKHTSSILTRGIFRGEICPPDIIHHAPYVSMARHASGLNYSKHM